MKKVVIMMAIAITCVFVLMSGVSQATYMGTIYEGDSSAAYNPSLGPTPSGSYHTMTFTVDKLDFTSEIVGGNTYGGFLGGSGNVNNLILADPSWANHLIVTANHNNVPIASPSIYGTFFQFTGTAYFPENVTIRHDDGFYLKLVNTTGTFAINDWTPTSPEFTELHNAAGTYVFTLNYGAWNGFPEVLQVRSITSVPEPASMLLFGLGLLGLAGLRRRFKK